MLILSILQFAVKERTGLRVIRIVDIDKKINRRCNQSHQTLEKMIQILCKTDITLK